MRLRYCSCGQPVVLVRGAVENERPTGTWHVCEHPFGYTGGTTESGDPGECVNTIDGGIV